MNTVQEAGVIIIPGGTPTWLLVIMGVIVAGIIVVKVIARNQAAKPKEQRTPMEWARGEHPTNTQPTEDQKRAARIAEQHKQQMPGETADDFNRRIRS